jgi:crotonobetainyl-CoA:carnitine CoA-transferase CaiB-like acyl-CoA transferase
VVVAAETTGAVEGAGPLDGVRVIELAQWVMGPAAGALLADWGADVIRVERLTGDPYGGLATQGIGTDSGGVNLSMAMVNRGKRSVAIDLQTEAGRQVLDKLLEGADVFITNLRAKALERLNLDADSVMSAYPHLIYARGNGYGARGPEAERGGFDSTAFWARGGLAHVLTPAECANPITQRGAMGDRNAAVALGFGITTALIRKVRTGKGSLVDTSLLATAMWTLSSDVLSAMQGIKPRALPTLINPVFGAYRTSDGRHIQLAFLESDRFWAPLCRALGRDDMIDDPRFSDLHARAANVDECVAQLRAEFGRRSFADCRQLLGELDVPWAPVQAVEELLDDPQVQANGYIADVEHEGVPPYALPTGPVQLDGHPPKLRRAPEHGEHTESVLLDFGYTWDDITELKSSGVIL